MRSKSGIAVFGIRVANYVAGDEREDTPSSGPTDTKAPHSRPAPPDGGSSAFDAVVDTSSLDEAEYVIGENLARVRMTAADNNKPTRTRIWRSAIGTTRIYVEDMSYDFSYTMVPPEKILLLRVHSGATTLHVPGGPDEVFAQGQAAAHGALEAEPFSGAFHRCRLDVFLIDRLLLNQVAAGPSQVEESVRLTGATPVSEAANRQLVAAMDHVRAALVDNPQAMRNPLIAGAAQRYLAVSMLASYPNTAALEPTIEDRRDATPALLRKATAFIEDNVHVDITIADIAAAVYATPRALQYMFRKYHDCTPMEYVRRVRLHRARLDLLAGDALTTTVGDVARRWGFGNVGRFAVRYRNLYGESPHVTLRR